MGTRSRIGRQNADGTVSAIYCHWDGYLSNVGAILHKHYQDATKVDALIALGDLSSIAEEIGEEHDFDWRNEYYKNGGSWENDPRDKMCNAYGRDRKEEKTAAQIVTDADLFWKTRHQRWAEYQYLYTDGAWLVQVYDATPVPLSDALTEE